MINMYDCQIVDRDFNLENTINENIMLKNSNQTLKGIIAIVSIAIIGVLIANKLSKTLEEQKKQRV